MLKTDEKLTNIKKLPEILWESEPYQYIFWKKKKKHAFGLASFQQCKERMLKQQHALFSHPQLSDGAGLFVEHSGVVRTQCVGHTVRWSLEDNKNTKILQWILKRSSYNPI